MKCYSLEELLAFAMNPEKPEQEGIAVHVIKCGKCRKDFELVLETLGNEVQAPLPGDKALAEAATKELFTRQKWNSFSNFIVEWNCNCIFVPSASSIKCSICNFAFLFERINPVRFYIIDIVFCVC